jgi:hypothetical protein
VPPVPCKGLWAGFLGRGEGGVGRFGEPAALNLRSSIERTPGEQSSGLFRDFLSPFGAFDAHLFPFPRCLLSQYSCHIGSHPGNPGLNDPGGS